MRLRANVDRRNQGSLRCGRGPGGVDDHRAASKAAGLMVGFVGLDPVIPVDVSATFANPSSSSQSAPAVTTGGAGRMVVRVWANKALSAIVPPGGLGVLGQATGSTPLFRLRV